MADEGCSASYHDSKDDCLPCGIGPSLITGSSLCQTCMQGYSPNYDRTACVSCPKGKYGSQDEEICTSCPLGFISLKDGKVKCDRCDEDEFANKEGNRCDQCLGTEYLSRKTQQCQKFAINEIISRCFEFTAAITSLLFVVGFLLRASSRVTMLQAKVYSSVFHIDHLTAFSCPESPEITLAVPSTIPTFLDVACLSSYFLSGNYNYLHGFYFIIISMPCIMHCCSRIAKKHGVRSLRKN